MSNPICCMCASRTAFASWRRCGPPDYAAWHEWAERMSQTHQQRRCSECGRWVVWVELSGNAGQLVDAAGEVW